MKIGERIKELRTKKGIYQKDLAQKLQIATSTVAMWETGKREPSLETVRMIADVFGVSVDSLLRDCGGQAPPNAAVIGSALRMVPVFESVSAGFGAEAENHIIATIPLYIESDAEAAETICVRVCGDSMHPKIEDGDLVQVHKQETAETGDIVVILDGDAAYVKRFIKTPTGVVLESVNPAYPPMRYTRAESNDLRIVGVVRRIVRDL